MNATAIWNRMRYGWTFMRMLYLVMGITIVIQASMISQWPGIFLGAYFMVMGLFSLGCASGQCAYVPPSVNRNNDTVEFKEIKESDGNSK